MIDHAVDDRDIYRDYLLRGRGVEDPCIKCEGFGTILYSSGATWRGGMGTATHQRDVCDACWGSGDRYHSGVDLRRLRDEENKRVAERAVELLAHSVGCELGPSRLAITHIIEALQKIVDKRGAPAANYLPELALGLANTLRRGIGAPEVRSRW